MQWGGDTPSGSGGEGRDLDWERHREQEKRKKNWGRECSPKLGRAILSIKELFGTKLKKFWLSSRTLGWVGEVKEAVLEQ